MIKINELINNPRIKIIGMLLIIISLSLIFLKLAGMLWEKNNSLKNKIKKGEEEITRSAKIFSLQEGLNSEINKRILEISSIQKNFFQDVEEIFSSLNHFAQEAKISLQGINPGERARIEVPERDDMYLEILPLTLKLSCDYQQLLTFLKRIEESKRNISVINIMIQNDAQDIWNHKVDIELKTPLLIYVKTNE